MVVDHPLLGRHRRSGDRWAALPGAPGLRDDAHEPGTARGQRPSEPSPCPSVGCTGEERRVSGLRRISQAELAARVTVLGHTVGRSAVSAIEVKSRSVTVDELFGLAISMGVTIGQLLGPTGPDHSRPLAWDVGLMTEDGEARPIAPWLSRLWAASRPCAAFADDDRGVDPKPAEELPAATEQDLDTLGLNEGNQTADWTFGRGKY